MTASTPFQPPEHLLPVILCIADSQFYEVDDESIGCQKSSHSPIVDITWIISGMNPITKIKSVLTIKANLAARNNRFIEAVFFGSLFTVLALAVSISFIVKFLLTTSLIGREYVLRLIIIGVPALSIVAALIFDYLNLRLTCKKT